MGRKKLIEIVRNILSRRIFFVRSKELPSTKMEDKSLATRVWRILVAAIPPVWGNSFTLKKATQWIRKKPYSFHHFSGSPLTGCLEAHLTNAQSRRIVLWAKGKILQEAFSNGANLMVHGSLEFLL